MVNIREMLLDKLIKLLPSKPVYAHCDIPCGIYDPHAAQMAAHTILRMTKLLIEVEVPEGEKIENIEYTKHHNTVARMIVVKEKHGEMVEHELVTLWADYFKEEHLKDYPELHDKVWKAIKLTGKVRQNIDLEAAQELLKNVQEIAEIFWKTKGMEPVRIPSGYPTEGEIVTHK